MREVFLQTKTFRNIENQKPIILNEMKSELDRRYQSGELEVLASSV